LLFVAIILIGGIFFYFFVFTKNAQYSSQQADVDNANHSITSNYTYPDLYKDNITETDKFIVLTKIPRNTQYFTEGLFVDDDGNLVESSGKFGSSKLIKYQLDYPDKLISEFNLEESKFAEGVCKLNNIYYQLTWLNREILIYDNGIDKISKIGVLPNDIKEGWGITSDGKYLIISSGSSNLYFVDPFNFNLFKKLKIKDKDGIVYKMLNELEYVDGSIYTNVWKSNFILKINSTTGIIEEKYDFTKLVEYEQNFLKSDITNSEFELNGVAYFKTNNLFVITGKMWKHLYVVEFKDIN